MKRNRKLLGWFRCVACYHFDWDKINWIAYMCTRWAWNRNTKNRWRALLITVYYSLVAPFVIIICAYSGSLSRPLFSFFLLLEFLLCRWFPTIYPIIYLFSFNHIDFSYFHMQRWLGMVIGLNKTLNICHLEPQFCMVRQSFRPALKIDRRYIKHS